jgi:leader peptidase (prepilin peptidase) / N-methyltransferase
MTELQSVLQPYAAWVGGLLGLVIGSFLNVVILRMPKILERQWLQDAQPHPTLQTPQATPQPPHFNLATPASHCPQCQHRLAWWENLPVISYLALKGRCHACHAPIGWRYPAIELLSALALSACFQHWGLGLEAVVWAGFVCTLLALAVIDWDTTFLPDQITQPLTWAGLIVAALGLSGTGLTHALWGAVAGYVSLWLVYWLFKLCTGKEGMGYGDFKLFAALGAWFGWTALMLLIVLASLAGIAVGLVLQHRQQLREQHYIPFGPFLAMAAGVYMIWGDFFTRLGWA